ncbi:MAG TPA: hypothetical protein VIL48_06965 [Acidimicrobiales bacterium]
MLYTTPMDRTRVAVASEPGPTSVGQDGSEPPTVDEIRAGLASVAEQLRALWSVALEQGDFDEITRIVDASHAVERALVALDTPARVGGWSPRRPSHR